jgi:hypothetical protein
MTDTCEKDLESMLNFIFEHEFEDYVERLEETFPEDKEFIRECVQKGNIDSLDKYAWNGTREVPSIYANAVRIYKEVFCA